jgi:hypothetical protein
MAEYKHPAFLKQINDAQFDQLHHPAAPTPLSGIYRCHVCGHEAVSTRHHPLPPQNHHQHANRQPIQWRLIVASTHA